MEEPNEQGGVEGLEEQSRAPHSCPHALSSDVASTRGKRTRLGDHERMRSPAFHFVQTKYIRLASCRSEPRDYGSTETQLQRARPPSRISKQGGRLGRARVVSHVARGRRTLPY